MSNIPRAREIIAEAAASLPLGDATRAMLEVALPMLTRQRPVRRAPRAKRYVTQRLIREICAFARKHPDMHLSDIATHFGVNRAGWRQSADLARDAAS